VALENCSLIILLRDYSNFFAAVDDYMINCHQSVLDDGSLLTSAYLGKKTHATSIRRQSAPTSNMKCTVSSH